MKLKSVITATCVLASVNLAGAAPFAYVVNSGTQNVSVIDTATDSLVPGGPIALPAGYAYGVAVGASGQYVYVGIQDPNVISVIDTAKKIQVKGIGLGTDTPGGLAVNAAETRLYVTSRMSNTLIIIDISGAGAAEVGRVAVDDISISNPEGVVLSPDGLKAYVANSFTGKVAEITLDEANNIYTRTSLTTVGSNPVGLAISSAEVSGAGTGYKLYASSLSGQVKMVNTATKAVTALKVGTGTVTVAITPDNSKVYAPTNSLDKLYVIDAAANPNVVLGTLYDVIAGPYGSSVTPDGTKLYITMNTSTAGETVNVFNTTSNTVTSTVALPAGAKPTSMGNFIGPLLPFTLTASASGTCAISPVGDVQVNSIGSRKFTASATSGTCDVTVDGASVAAGVSIYNYTFTNVVANHTITSYPPLTYFNVIADWTTTVGGCLESTPAGISCGTKNAPVAFLAGSNVTLKATSGFKAELWIGACAGTVGDTCVIRGLTSAKTAGANVIVGGGPIRNFTTSKPFQTWAELLADSATAAGNSVGISTNIASLTTTGTLGLQLKLSSQWLAPDCSTKDTYKTLALTITDVAIISDDLTL